jgi:osmotically-inducible protein OsmY
MRFTIRTILMVLALVTVCGVPELRAQKAVPDSQLLADVQGQLKNKRFAGIQASVEDGVVTLTGTTDRYAVKMEAENKVKHTKEAASIRNQIAVAVPENVSDVQLFQKLSKGLAYDRVGYGTTAFNDIELNVSQGVVTVTGTVVNPTDKDSAISFIAGTAGVRDVVDNLAVAPTSPMDDRIRRAEFRAIYGYPSLNKYAIDPAKTIRIVVVNGHVTLTGVVDSRSDSDTAYLRANGVAGVFSVTNKLQVAGGEAQR